MTPFSNAGDKLMTGNRSPLHRIPIGVQLGHLEYPVTPANLQSFRDAVAYPAAAYPNLALPDGLTLLTRKYGPALTAAAIGIRRTDHYLRPPEPGRRVQTTGWVRDISQSRGVDLLTVATFAVDEIGTEILRSEQTYQFSPGRSPQRQGRRPSRTRSAAALETLPPLTKPVTEETIASFTAARLLLPAATADHPAAPSSGIHAGAALASGMGLAATVAPAELGLAYLHELLDRRFGIDLRQGGRLTVHYLRPIYAGDTLTAQALITRQETAPDGRVHHHLQVSLSNQRGERPLDGSAQITVPSPLT